MTILLVRPISAQVGPPGGSQYPVTITYIDHTEASDSIGNYSYTADNGSAAVSAEYHGVRWWPQDIQPDLTGVCRAQGTFNYAAITAWDAPYTTLTVTVTEATEAKVSAFYRSHGGGDAYDKLEVNADSGLSPASCSVTAVIDPLYDDNESDDKFAYRTRTITATFYVIPYTAFKVANFSVTSTRCTGDFNGIDHQIYSPGTPGSTAQMTASTFVSWYMTFVAAAS